MLHDGVQTGETARFWLRRETRTDHEALHGHSSFERLGAGRLDVAGYRSLMLRQLGFYRRIDPLLAHGLNAFGLPDAVLARQPRGDLIAADLATLGVDARSAPVLGDSPEVASPAALGGVLYVIEGALLGASTLAAAASLIPGPNGVAAASFWLWSRDACAERWPRACALIDGLVETDRDRGEMLAAARRTFQLYGAWFAPLDLASVEAL